MTYGKRDRKNYDGATYHITVRCNNRQHLLEDDLDFRQYLTILGKCKEKYEFKLHDYVLLNNHIHLILRLSKVLNISKIMHSINRWYAMWHNKYYNHTGHFWEERFHGNLISDDLQLLSTMVYIHLNPVKADLCEVPCNWEFSGARYYLKGAKNTLITPPDIYLNLGPRYKIRQKHIKT